MNNQKYRNSQYPNEILSLFTGVPLPPHRTEDIFNGNGIDIDSVTSPLPRDKQASLTINPRDSRLCTLRERCRNDCRKKNGIPFLLEDLWLSFECNEFTQSFKTFL